MRFTQLCIIELGVSLDPSSMILTKVNCLFLWYCFFLIYEPLTMCRLNIVSTLTLNPPDQSEVRKLLIWYNVVECSFYRLLSYFNKSCLLWPCEPVVIRFFLGIGFWWVHMFLSDFYVAHFVILCFEIHISSFRSTVTSIFH